MLIAFLILWLSSNLLGVEVTITLDDHPMPAGHVFSLNERAQRFCDALEKHGYQAAFFCIGSYCENADPCCLMHLNDAGHFLGNHSFTHRHLSSMSLEEFHSEIIKTETILNGYSQFRKWFRFPYLDYGNRTHMGGSKEKASSALNILKEQGYQEGFVTINTFDWHINFRLQEALSTSKNVDYARLKEAYLYLLNEWCQHYIHVYQALPMQEVTHVLLLHANDLNALFLDDVLGMIKENGWKIASPEKAFAESNWRELFSKQPELFPDKPTSLNEKAIDDTLECYGAFH